MIKIGHPLNLRVADNNCVGLRKEKLSSGRIKVEQFILYFIFGFPKCIAFLASQVASK